jgi:putative transposase
MPRQARIIPPEGFLHVISRGNNHRKLFLAKNDFKIFYMLLNKLKEEESIRIYHYCLMSNHVHLLAGVGENSNISRFMKRLGLKYFYHYKKKHNYTGHLWQDRFKSKIIERDEYLIQCGKYIELNPVRAGIVKIAEDYPYSSYLYYGLGIQDKLIDDDPLYADFGRDNINRQLKYRKMIIDEVSYKRFIIKTVL